MPPKSAEARTLPRLLDPSLSHLRDVTLIPSRTPTRTVRAHRFVLAACSPVLRASLQADPHASALTLAHADADALDAALQYVYGRHAAIEQLPPASLWTALATCVAYAILQPLEAVQSRIVQSVTYRNVFYHWGMAERYNLPEVQLTCRNVVKDNFIAVSKQPEFLDICSKRLARVLRIHDLIVYTEHDVFQALERWLAFDVDARAEQALHLLRLVRLPTIPDRTLLRVCRSPYFGGHNEFYQLLLEALIRRTEVRIVHAPRLAVIERRSRQAKSRDYTHPPAFSPMGVTDTDLLPARPSPSQQTDWATHTASQHSEPAPKQTPVTAAPAAPASAPASAAADPAIVKTAAVDYNRKENRTVLFEGHFPLRWYKSVRFRPRNANSLLFTVVIPKWSLCKRRFVSESRSFLNYKWSLWVDPFSSDPTRMSRTAPVAPQQSKPITPTPTTGKPDDDQHLYVGNTLDTTATPQPSSPPRASTPDDETDYISLYLCCESELGVQQAVDARVDFGLFVVSATEEYGMERKVCVGRTFRTHGQAMGFRRHIRRNRLQSAAAGLYSREKDELVVGAHLVAPHVERPELITSSLSQLSRASIAADDFRSESPLSPPSAGIEARAMGTLDNDPSPILTATSGITT